MARDQHPTIPLIPHAVSEGISDADLMALWDEEMRHMEEAFDNGTSVELPAVQQGLHLRVVHLRSAEADKPL
ncbi:MAG: hypothetical protein IT229_08520 [Flavobacteriales bacterium]|nr:hypothetical protein [Flavobacteriales bacterium]